MDDATLKRLLAEATRGKWEPLPWEEDAGGTDWNVWGPKSSSFPLDHDFRGDFGNGADAKLMALSKDLAAEVLRLRAVEKAAKDMAVAVAYLCGENDDLIRIAIAGNPSAIEDVLTAARAALSAFNATQEGV